MGKFVFIFRDQLHEFDVSDGLHNLINICHHLIDRQELHLPFDDDPGGIMWSLVPQEQRHLTKFEIYEFIEEKKTSSTPVFSLIVKRNFLTTLLIVELWKLSILYCEPSFQTERDVFPKVEFDTLLLKWKHSSLAPSPDYLDIMSRPLPSTHGEEADEWMKD